MIKKFFRELILSSGVDLVKMILVLFGPSLLAYIGSVVLPFFAPGTSIPWYLVALTVFIVAWASIMIYETVSSNRPKFQSVDYDFLYKKFAISLEYVEPKKIR